MKTEAVGNGKNEDAKVADDMLGELESLMKESKQSDKIKSRYIYVDIACVSGCVCSCRFDTELHTANLRNCFRLSHYSYSICCVL